MDFDFQRIDSIAPSEIERAAGATALRVQQSLERVSALASTFVLGKKAFRSATARLPPGHRPLDLLDEEIGRGRQERAARAHERVCGFLDLVPVLGIGTSRCLVWSSPVWRPRRLSMPGLVAVIEAPKGELAQAVTELWAAIFLEPVLERAPSGFRRLEIAVGVTEDQPEARTALLAALASGESGRDEALPLPGQAAWTSPPLAFDRGLDRWRAAASRPALRHAFGTSPLTPTIGRWGPGLDPEQVKVVVDRQAGAIGAAVARDVIGPLEPALEVGINGEGAFNLARLGGQLALHVAQMAELGRDVEKTTARAEARHEWMVEMDLALLPDDGLRTTLEEQLALLSAVTDLALRACLAATRLSRTFAALSGGTPGELDLGVSYPLAALLRDFEHAVERASAGDGSAASTNRVPRTELEAFAERHPVVFPRFDGQARASLHRAFELAAQRGRPVLSVERRIELARVRGDEAAARFESRLPRLLAARLSSVRSVVEGASQLRERARALEVLADAMLRTVALEVDRRLPRLEPGLPAGAVWHCHIEEILDTVDLRGTSLRARVIARSWGEAAYHAAANLGSPRASGAVQLLEPIPLARARGLDQAVWLLVAPELVTYAGRPGDTLPCLARSLDLPWASPGPPPAPSG